MKKVLLGLLFSAFGFGAIAQQASPVVAPKGYMPSATPVLVKKNNNSLSKQGDSVHTWYSYLDSARNFTTFQGYNNSFIFPDSMVKQIYGDGQGGQVLEAVNLMSMGQLFDVKSDFLTDYRAYNCGYKLDSVALAYGYVRNIPGAVDTLIFQFYTDEANGGILRGTFNNTGDKTAWLRADVQNSKGVGAKKEFKYLLTDKDTAKDLKILTVGVPGGGMKVPAAGSAANQPKALSGFTVTFKPGYDYSLGDTLDSRWDQPEPTKKLNNFRIFVQNDANKEQDNSYNHSETLIKSVKYKLPSAGSWATPTPLYIPGDAWNDYRQHLYSLFHISFAEECLVSGVAETKGQNTYALGDIFPNPAQNAATLKFVLPATENVNVQIYNVVGQHIQTVANGNYAAGTHTVNVNTENMKPGVYLYTINAGNFSQTKRFTVVK